MRTPISLFLLTLSCLAAAQRVRVVDPHEAAIAAAELTFSQAGRSAAARTDLGGEADAPLAPPYTVRATAPGFEPLERTVAKDAGEVVLRLRPAAVHTTVNVVVRQDPVALDAGNITAPEIERTGARTVLDAVERMVPGAFVTRRGVMGYGIATNGTGGLSIRGVGGSPNTGVLIIVDGRPDFQGLMGHPLPDFYSLSDAASVSVTEGPASVLYGSNALGGAVEVKPAQPSPGMSTRLSSGLGTFWTGQHRLSHGTRFERFFYSAHAGLSHTSGDRPSSDFRNQDGTLALGYDFSERWKASLQGRYGHFHVEDPGPVTAPLSDSYARVGRGGFSLNLDNTGRGSWGYARVYSSHGKHFITDGFRSTDRTTGARVDQSVALAPSVSLQLGTDLVNYGGAARNLRQRLDYGEHGETSAAGFTRVQWAPAGMFRGYAGLRYEHSTVFGGIAVPEAGATAQFGRYSLSAAVSKGFRNPTIRELYLFPAPNPLLEPERLWNYQLTLQARPVNELSLSATLFYADLNNLIVTLGRFPNLSLRNTGRLLNRGIETSARWRPVRRLALQSGYAWLHSTNLPVYLPEHKFDGSVELDAGRFFLSAGATATGRRWADAAHRTRLEGYTNAFAKLMVPAGKRTTFFVSGDNLLNQRYQVVTGYPMPLANASAGLTLSF